jgi:hypothetical protein
LSELWPAYRATAIEIKHRGIIYTIMPGHFEKPAGWPNCQNRLPARLSCEAIFFNDDDGWQT